jgi:hypothetical protein
MRTHHLLNDHTPHLSSTKAIEAGKIIRLPAFLTQTESRQSKAAFVNITAVITIKETLFWTDLHPSGIVHPFDVS